LDCFWCENVGTVKKQKEDTAKKKRGGVSNEDQNEECDENDEEWPTAFLIYRQNYLSKAGEDEG
jgi:hypothetical protein